MKIKCIICKLFKDYDFQPIYINILENLNMLIVYNYGYYVFELHNSQEHAKFIFYYLVPSTMGAP